MAKTKDPNAPRIEWLRGEIARLEKDAETFEEGEDQVTGLTLEEEHILAQHRFDLSLLTSD